MYLILSFFFSSVFEGSAAALAFFSFLAWPGFSFCSPFSCFSFFDFFSLPSFLLSLFFFFSFFSFLAAFFFASSLAFSSTFLACFNFLSSSVGFSSPFASFLRIEGFTFFSTAGCFPISLLAGAPARAMRLIEPEVCKIPVSHARLCPSQSRLCPSQSRLRFLPFGAVPNCFEKFEKVLKSLHRSDQLRKLSRNFGRICICIQWAGNSRLVTNAVVLPPQLSFMRNATRKRPCWFLYSK